MSNPIFPPPFDDMADDELLDELAMEATARFGTAGEVSKDETHEALGFANEVFCTGKMRPASRKRVIEILTRLRALPPFRLPHPTEG